MMMNSQMSLLVVRTKVLTRTMFSSTWILESTFLLTMTSLAVLLLKRTSLKLLKKTGSLLEGVEL